MYPESKPADILNIKKHALMHDGEGGFTSFLTIHYQDCIWSIKYTKYIMKLLIKQEIVIKEANNPYILRTVHK